MSAIEIRASQPEDVEAAIPLIYSSGPDAFNYVLKTNKNGAKEFLHAAFITSGGEFSYDNHFCLLKDQKVVGIGAIFSHERAKKFTIKDIFKIIKFYKWYAFTIIIRGLKIERIFQLPKKNEFCIGHIGVSEKERGQGLGQQLIEFIMQQTNHKPEEYFVLDVSVKNPRAQALYERMGFKVRRNVISKLKNKHGIVVNHFRMEKR